MLVLARKVGQSIQIGDGINITVTQVKGNTIRLGITAPPEVSIRRGELQPHSNSKTEIELDSSELLRRLPNLIGLDEPNTTSTDILNS